jgi:hypothetical protein
VITRSSIFFFIFLLFASCGDKHIHQATGVEVHFRIDMKMFPLYWLNDEIKPHAESLPIMYRYSATNIIKTAFGKYPITLLHKNLRKVYVLRELNFYGVNYGGTNNLHDVYVVYYDYILPYVERTFHHEFGAVLMYHNEFDTTAFKLLLPDSVSYGVGGLEALKSGKSSTTFNYDLIEKGFLSEYGSSCLEEDFCSVCEQLFLPETDFWYIYDTYPLMHKRIKYVIDFYHSLDTTFSEKYFRSFDKGEYLE